MSLKGLPFCPSCGLTVMVDTGDLQKCEYCGHTQKKAATVERREERSRK